MFNVGDEVEVFVDIPGQYPITRIGSYGKVVHSDQYGSLVLFEWVNRPDLTTLTCVHKYYINNEHLQVRVSDGLTPIVRKIRSMYARQHRKTGHSCFL